MKRRSLLFGTAAIFFAATATPGSAQVPNLLGSATGTTIACPRSKFAANVCYQVAVTGCENTAGVNAYFKITLPQGSPIGLVVLASGGAVTDLYELYTYGTTTLNDLLAADFTVAQISFGGPFTKNQPNGFLVGSGGPGAAACNYATAVQWAYENLASNGLIPVCLTGNSSGAALIGYALAQYGMNGVVTFAEITSGPPYSHLDEGCIPGTPYAETPCGEGMQGWGVGLSNAELYIDPSYGTSPGPICSEAWKTKSSANKQTFINDSVLSGNEQLSYPQTSVNFVLGGLDLSNAPNQANAYYEAITSTKNLTCVADAPHSIPDSQAGAIQIADDLIASCKPAAQ
ncbi:MAG: hypothetical protein ABSB14_15520 [Candidatus Sulfotelmatobacter sp.]|jgi:hypothetical protein